MSTLRLNALMRRLTLMFLMVSTIALEGALGPSAFATEDFYQNRTVRLYIGISPGGEYDMTARIFAKHIRRFIPGEPTVVGQSMPGANSVVAANYVFNVAPQ